MILCKVSFSNELFIRELKKAFKYLQLDELRELKLYVQSLVHSKPQLQTALLVIST